MGESARSRWLSIVYPNKFNTIPPDPRVAERSQRQLLARRRTVAIQQRLPPVAVVQIPLHGSLQACFKAHDGGKTQFLHYLAGINGITAVVAGAVGDKPDCRFAVTPQRGNPRSEEHTSELQSQPNLACRLLPAT